MDQIQIAKVGSEATLKSASITSLDPYESLRQDAISAWEETWEGLAGLTRGVRALALREARILASENVCSPPLLYTLLALFTCKLENTPPFPEEEFRKCFDNLCESRTAGTGSEFAANGDAFTLGRTLARSSIAHKLSAEIDGLNACYRANKSHLLSHGPDFLKISLQLLSTVIHAYRSPGSRLPWREGLELDQISKSKTVAGLSLGGKEPQPIANYLVLTGEIFGSAQGVRMVTGHLPAVQRWYAAQGLADLGLLRNEALGTLIVHLLEQTMARSYEVSLGDFKAIRRGYVKAQAATTETETIVTIEVQAPKPVGIYESDTAFANLVRNISQPGHVKFQLETSALAHPQDDIEGSYMEVHRLSATFAQQTLWLPKYNPDEYGEC